MIALLFATLAVAAPLKLESFTHILHTKRLACQEQGEVQGWVKRTCPNMAVPAFAEPDEGKPLRSTHALTKDAALKVVLDGPDIFSAPGEGGGKLNSEALLLAFEVKGDWVKLQGKEYPPWNGRFVWIRRGPFTAELVARPNLSAERAKEILQGALPPPVTAAPFVAPSATAAPEPIFEEKVELPEALFARRLSAAAVQLELGMKDIHSFEKELKVVTLVGEKGTAFAELKKISEKCTKLSESCGKDFAEHAGGDTEDCRFLGEYSTKVDIAKLGENWIAFPGKRAVAKIARFQEKKALSLDKFKKQVEAGWRIDAKAGKLFSKEMDPNGKALKEIALKRCHMGEMAPLSILSCCSDGWPDCPYWALEGSELAFQESSHGPPLYFFAFELEGKPRALVRSVGEIESKNWFLYSKGAAVWSRSEIFANEIVCD